VISASWVRHCCAVIEAAPVGSAVHKPFSERSHIAGRPSRAFRWIAWRPGGSPHRIVGRLAKSPHRVGRCTAGVPPAFVLAFGQFATGGRDARGTLCFLWVVKARIGNCAGSRHPMRTMFLNCGT
ncbi:MAG: hypothetical protein ABSE73_28905, partial [Planctomycetota bacterium]